MNYLKGGLGASRRIDEQTEMVARPLTPRSELARGSLLASLQTSRGLCPQGKCIKKQDHAGPCWPAPTE